MIIDGWDGDNCIGGDEKQLRDGLRQGQVFGCRVGTKGECVCCVVAADVTSHAVSMSESAMPLLHLIVRCRGHMTNTIDLLTWSIEISRRNSIEMCSQNTIKMNRWNTIEMYILNTVKKYSVNAIEMNRQNSIEMSNTEMCMKMY